MKLSELIDWLIDLESIIDMFRHPKTALLCFAIVAIIVIVLIVVFA
ncbi:hypothetical protein [Neisseria sp. Ec49-e6-T10]